VHTAPLDTALIIAPATDKARAFLRLAGWDGDPRFLDACQLDRGAFSWWWWSWSARLCTRGSRIRPHRCQTREGV